MKLMQCAMGILAAVSLTGCSTTISNLTPSTYPRNPSNIYPLEVQFQTDQKSIRENTITPFVIVGAETFPMEAAPMLKNRWEAQVPVPASTNHIYYRYKFDYKYDRIPAPRESSRLSPTYHLEIVDK